jgi:uncharacterized protein (DUF1697 family)
VTRHIALLRAVNVGGRKVTMAQLCKAAEALGHANVATLLASGNLVFEAGKAAPAKLEAGLEAAIEAEFGVETDVMVRNPAEWSAILKANPFPKEAKADPAHLLVRVHKTAPDPAVLKAYLDSYKGPERAKLIGREMFIVYPDGIGESKLALPKKLGPGTARNWNTVLKLGDMLTD